MKNEPVAWIKQGRLGFPVLEFDKPFRYDSYAIQNSPIPLYTQDQLEEARKLGMQQERALWNLSTSTQEIMDTHPVKELTISDEEMLELENALKVCDYKYFGSCEFSEKQWEAFEVLEKHAKAILRKAQEK